MESSEKIIDIIQKSLQVFNKQIVDNYVAAGGDSNDNWVKNIVETSVVSTNNLFQVSIKGADYVHYIEHGRNPSDKMPPLESIRKWVGEKNIASAVEQKAKEGIIFAIANSIKQNGYAGKHFLEKTFNNNNPEYSILLNNVADILKEDTKDTIKKIFINGK